MSNTLVLTPIIKFKGQEITTDWLNHLIEMRMERAF